MAVALLPPETEHETDRSVEEAVQRVLNSPQFARAETQRKLLQYLWLNRHLSLSEYAIATDALGRNSHFDPNTDASIRVHISRLRRKLKDYYVETGEPELLVIPTGTHQLIAQTSVLAKPEPVPELAIAPLGVGGWLRLHSVAVLGGLCGLLVTLLLATAALAFWQGRQLKLNALRQPSEPNSFWRSFLEGDAPVKIVLPTPVFFNFPDHPWLKVRSTKVNAFDEVARDPDLKALAAKLGPIGLEQSYTVTWDTLAGIQISRYLDSIGQSKRVSFEVTRDSSLLSLEQSNVIVLGTDNTLRSMQEYIESMNFVMTPGEEKVINTHPEKGEDAAYWRVIQGSPKYVSSSVRHVEPSIIALLPGRAPGLKVLMLESRDTSGMVSLLSSNAGSNAVERLWRAHGSPKFFEMVTMTELEGNKPIRSWPVTLHAYTKAPPSKGL
ncbi:transcriptional regulatory protein [Terriglobus roseus DSM 18391]|uniref:Transcriptional regulatory protein n=1 Tax=Terriglobus roseus (strain DSM 18391 / NRRL B-41598 / KBS 63) TaxID=926566 RepID=I3ZIQ3_TERRK|nr:helix-turn-helix domain-containing protein [Terriglobus roseus]AFL89121.1 transcriptional regulatory protein [Terriglobus roseus DSM 18391]